MVNMGSSKVKTGTQSYTHEVTHAAEIGAEKRL